MNTTDQPDSGLPDVATITRIANELFARAKSGAPAGAAGAGAGAPSAPPADAGYYFLSRPATSAPRPAAAEAAPPSALVAPPGLPGYGVPDDAELVALLARHGRSGAGAGPYYFLPAPAVPAQAPVTAPVAAPLPAGAHAPDQPPAAPFDSEAVRRDFPILQERPDGRALIWLDNAATTHKPRCVIERIMYFYEHENSNIHRAAHALAARATDAYEGARKTVQGFLNARSPNEIIFVRGATEAINLVAQSWGRQHIGRGDEIVITALEHHANIVPWQQLCQQCGATLKVAPVDADGQLMLAEFGRLLGARTRLVAFPHVSNALGTITPAAQMCAMAHAVGARVLIDGAQAVSHLRADMQELDCDWYAFSGHKVFGPTGIGVLYGKEALLNATAPWQGGGNMISDVTFEESRYQMAPARFEAGTGNIADAVGLAAALDYVSRIGLDAIAQHEHQLLEYGNGLLQAIPGLRLIGTAAAKAGVLSFVLDGLATAEVGSALSREGIAVRAGHHCAQPILRRFGVESTVRPSLAFYNTGAELEALAAALRRIRQRARSG